MKLTRFDATLNIRIALVMGAILSAVLPIVMKGDCTLHGFWFGWVVSTVLSFLITGVLPAVRWDEKFAAYRAPTGIPFTMRVPHIPKETH